MGGGCFIAAVGGARAPARTARGFSRFPPTRRAGRSQPSEAGDRAVGRVGGQGKGPRWLAFLDFEI